MNEKECEVEEVFKKPTLIEDLGMMFPTEMSRKKARYGIYECPSCGVHFKAQTSSIKNSNTKSCGCYHKSQVSKRITTHGESSLRLYLIWAAMKKRTLNTKGRAYKDWGGRGITICDEWKDDYMPFRDWALSNGYSDELSIDRVNNNKGYSPDNCRWTTSIMQGRNQRMKGNNTSGFRGVSFNKKASKFRASIRVDKKPIYLGEFPTAVEAGIVYNNYIIENNLEGFILNEIPFKAKGEDT